MLRSSSQCVALVQYNRTCYSQNNIEVICRLQSKIQDTLDKHLNRVVDEDESPKALISETRTSTLYHIPPSLMHGTAMIARRKKRSVMNKKMRIRKKEPMILRRSKRIAVALDKKRKNPLRRSPRITALKL